MPPHARPERNYGSIHFRQVFGISQMQKLPLCISYEQRSKRINIVCIFLGWDILSFILHSLSG
jgi:hypothetical protein